MRNINDYNKIKNMDSDQFTAYIIKKNGYSKNDYCYTEDCNSKTEGKPGYHRHHLGEKYIPNLSNLEVAKVNDFKWQRKDQLIYVTPSEHIFIHILYAEETPIAEIGRNGAQVLLDYYRDSLDPALVKVFEERLQRTGTLLKHNIDLYNDINYQLSKNNKALCTLATGGGKTTTALQYIVEHDLRALVLGPKRAIVEDWSDRRVRYPQIKDVMCYTSFMKKSEAEVLDYIKNFDIVILDEAHHLAKNQAWTINVEVVLKSNSCKVLGITAENKRTDKTRVADILFDGQVCKGMTITEMLKSGIFWPISYVSTLLTDPQFKLEPSCSFLQRDLDIASNIKKASNIIKEYRPDFRKLKGIVFIPRGDGSGDNFKEAKDLLVTVFGKEVLDYTTEITCKLGPKKCKKIKDDFNKAEFGFVITIDMFNEGIHPDGINTIIILRNSRSPLVVNQQIGRLTRLHKQFEQDPQCILFDLVNIVKTVDYRDFVKHSAKNEMRNMFKELADSPAKSSAVIYDNQCEELYKVLEKAVAFKEQTLFPELEPILF